MYTCLPNRASLASLTVSMVGLRKPRSGAGGGGRNQTNLSGQKMVWQFISFWEGHICPKWAKWNTDWPNLWSFYLCFVLYPSPSEHGIHWTTGIWLQVKRQEEGDKIITWSRSKPVWETNSPPPSKKFQNLETGNTRQAPEGILQWEISQGSEPWRNSVYHRVTALHWLASLLRMHAQQGGKHVALVLCPSKWWRKIWLSCKACSPSAGVLWPTKGHQSAGPNYQITGTVTRLRSHFMDALCCPLPERWCHAWTVFLMAIKLDALL